METKAKSRIKNPIETIESEIEITDVNNINSRIYEYVFIYLECKIELLISQFYCEIFINDGRNKDIFRKN